ncbi:hypothetical protein FM036_45290, partial [Nostoc sp. HG1]|nr:hypothetical protein [Nostoc sp. HG1]
DPERDTPEALRDFTDSLHPEMIGLTGTVEQVKAASEAYRTYFKAQPAEDEHYLVDHSTFTYLVLPQTGFAEDGKLPLEGMTMPIILEYFQKHPQELNIYIPRDR